MSVPLLFSGTALSSNSKESEVAPSPPKLSSLQQLSCDISVNAAILGSHIKSEGLTEPGFGSDAPLDLDRLIKDPQAQKARLELANLGKKLYLLMLGPALAQRGFFMNVGYPELVAFRTGIADAGVGDTNGHGFRCTLSSPGPTNNP